ncbi:MAG TPA: YihY/virulence factor BrkB family protein, partial [Verrucomicrobiae bacterium]|nr:YihY/virulence factor BrkB family protein [Verrucomicrobiae bacterium]
MILSIAFLLLISLLLTTAIAAGGKYFSHMMGNSEWLFQILNNVLSFGLITLLFAMMFKFVPDAKIAWKDVWVGAIFTAILFTVGKFGLGLYLGKSSVVSTYKAAGALLVLLLWVYYTAQIVFFGAELTQGYAHIKGRDVQPSAHAEVDAEKACQTEAAATYRDKNKSKHKPAASPRPALTMANALGAAPGSVSSRGHSKKTWGGILLLLLVLIPFEKKFLSAKT